MTPKVSTMVKRFINTLFAASITVSIMWIVPSLLFTSQSVGRFVTDMLMLESWYKPVIDAGPEVMDEFYFLALYVAVCWLVVLFAFYLTAKFLSLSGPFGPGSELEERIERKGLELTWARSLREGKKEAIERLRTLYRWHVNTPEYKTVIEQTEITEDSLPELVERHAESIDKLTIIRPIDPLTSDDIAQSIVQDVIRDAYSSVEGYETIIDVGFQTSWTGDYFQEQRGIAQYAQNGIVLVRDGTEKALLLHIMRLLAEAQGFVNRVPRGTSESVLEARKNLDMAAEALSVSREFYHDDEIPERKDEIIRWALAQVEEARA